MPLNKDNTTHFYRCLYSGQLEKVVLLKRGPNMQASTVATHELYDCRRSSITKKGTTVQHDMSADHRCTWHIPRTELDRVGVAYLSALDLFRDEKDRYWHPESGDAIEVKLFENMIRVNCQRADPPDPNLSPRGG